MAAENMTLEEYSLCDEKLESIDNTRRDNDNYIHDKIGRYQDEYNKSLISMRSQKQFVHDEEVRLYQNAEKLFNSFIGKIQNQKQLYFEQIKERLIEYSSLWKKNYKNQTTNLDQINSYKKLYAQIIDNNHVTPKYNEFIEGELEKYNPSECIKNNEYDIIEELQHQQTKLDKMFDLQIAQIYGALDIEQQYIDTDNNDYKQFQPVSRNLDRYNNSIDNDSKKSESETSRRSDPPKYEPLKVLNYRWQRKRLQNDREVSRNINDEGFRNQQSQWIWCDYSESTQYEKRWNSQNKKLRDNYQPCASLRRRIRFEGKVLTVLPRKKMGFVMPNYPQYDEKTGVAFYFADFIGEHVSISNPLFPGYTLQYELQYFEQPQPGYRAVKLHVVSRRKTASYDVNKVLFVENLPYRINDKGLFDLFADFGAVKSQVVRDHNSGQSRRFGFVHFATRHEAERAMDEMNMKVVHRKQIAVRFKRAERHEII